MQDKEGATRNYKIISVKQIYFCPEMNQLIKLTLMSVINYLVYFSENVKIGNNSQGM